MLMAPLSHVSAEENYIDVIYRQLVTEGSNTAKFEYNGEKLGAYDVLADVVKIDNEDTLYDGAMLRNRGNWVLLKQGSSYTLTAENAYDISEADSIAEEIVREVKLSAGDNATDRELFYEYLKYMADNFHFSDEVGKKKTFMNRNKEIIDVENFTDAYKNDKGIDCAGYATITYLVANKMGIDCELIEGGHHVHNIVKFSDSDKYTAFDLTLQNKYANLGILGNLLVKARNIFSSSNNKMLAKVCNGGRDYEAASIGEFVKMFKYYNGI